MQTSSGSRYSKWKADFLFIAFACAFWAASLLPGTDNPPLFLVVILFIVGSSLFVLIAPRPNAWPDLPAKVAGSRWQNWAVGLSVVFSIIAFGVFWAGQDTPEQFTGLPLILWVLSLLTFWVGVSTTHRISCA